MSLKNRLIEVTNQMQEIILRQPGVKPMDTEDFGWENYRWSGDKFRLAHIERFFEAGLLVAHVTCFPHEGDAAPIFGFDVVGSEKTGKIGGAFLDYSPVLYDTKWHDTEWNSDRILPEWATVFSDDFIALRPHEDEYEPFFELSLTKFEEYFNALDTSVHVDTPAAKALVIERQNEYCEKQASNPRTYAALKHKIGAERARYFMTEILFPKIVSI